jgi:hypothetical protein
MIDANFNLFPSIYEKLGILVDEAGNVRER